MPRIDETKALHLFYHTPLKELQARIPPRREATYIIMQIVSVTNVCVADCKYCAFYRRPGDKEGYVLSPSEIFEKTEELIAKGGCLIAMEGGFNPALKIDHYEKLFSGMRARY